MFLPRIKKSAAFASLAAAVAFAAPTGSAMASTHGQPAPFTVTPVLGGTIPVATSSSQATADAGVVEVAQNRRARRLRRLEGRTARRGRRAARRGFRNGRPGWYRGGRRFRHNGRWYWYNNGYYYDDAGVAVAAGLLGLAAGAIAGAAIAGANEPDVIVVDDPAVPAPFTGEWYRRCAAKYRSFRVSDGTFLGYDGVRKRCRLP